MTLYLVEQVYTDTQSLIYEFHRHDDGKKEIKKIANYKPYIFCDENAPIDNWNQVISTKKGFTTINGKKAKQVFLKKANYMRQIRKALSTMGFGSYEADIPFHNRYTNDLPEIAKGKIWQCFLDIETNSKDKFPDIESADQEICCLTIKLNGEIITWLCGEHLIGKDLSDLKHVRFIPKEEDMLEDFMTWMKNISPDILTAWNIGFDMEYLINRMARLGVDYKRFSPLHDVYINSYGQRKYIKCKGTVIFDQLEAYKLWRKYGNMPVLASYSLDYVARTVLEKTKLHHGKTMNDLWMNDVKTLIEYNQWDVELLDLIEQRCKIIDFFDEIRRKCRIQFDDVYKTTAMLDGYLIHNLNKSIILPNSNKPQEEDKFKGAFVFQPIAGLYDNILCLDIKGMYPNIIKTFNISYETLGGEIKLPIGTSFAKTPGLIPRNLDELAAERTEYKKKMKAAKTKAEYELWHQRQYGTKIIMNSEFGYLGYPGSRLYKKEVAASITGMGEVIIKEIIKWLSEIGYQVIYSDTDSVYVKAHHSQKLSVVAEGVELTEFINKKLDEYCTAIAGQNTIEIEFEKALEKVLFTNAKKRYAYRLLWEDGNNFDVDKNIKITGMSSKRSDFSKFGKTVQTTVIQMLIDGKSRNEVVDYLRKCYVDMKNGKINDEDIGFPKGIKKELWEYCPPGPIIKGAQFANLHYNTNFGKGSKPKFVWIEGFKDGTKPIVVLNDTEYLLESIAYATEIPKEFKVDWKKMAKNTFNNMLENIFEAAGWQWTDLDTKSLSDYF
jgi:DNA polymerase I